MYIYGTLISRLSSKKELAYKRLFLLLIFTFSFIYLSAQEEQVSITGKQLTIGQILKQIENQTNYTFAYSKSKFDTSKIVTISKNKSSLKSILTQVLAGTNYEYVVNNNHIVLIPAKVSQPVGDKKISSMGTAKNDISLIKPSVVKTDSFLSVPVQSLPTEMPVQALKDSIILKIEDGDIEKVGNSFYLVTSNGAKVELTGWGDKMNSGENKSSFSDNKVFEKRTPLIGIKTNLLYDLTSSINLGLEFGLTSRNTLDVSVNYNPWTFSDNSKLKHILIQPEWRYWLCESFNKHFLGIHVQYAHYNVGNINVFNKGILEDRYQGDLYGAGFSYGYQKYLSRRFSLEATIGVGYNYLKYDRYDCVKCGTLKGKESKNYIGVTKLGLSLIYMIK